MLSIFMLTAEVRSYIFKLVLSETHLLITQTPLQTRVILIKLRLLKYYTYCTKILPSIKGC